MSVYSTDFYQAKYCFQEIILRSKMAFVLAFATRRGIMLYDIH